MKLKTVELIQRKSLNASGFLLSYKQDMFLFYAILACCRDFVGNFLEDKESLSPNSRFSYYFRRQKQHSILEKGQKFTMCKIKQTSKQKSILLSHQEVKDITVCAFNYNNPFFDQGILRLLSAYIKL